MRSLTKLIFLCALVGGVFCDWGNMTVGDLPSAVIGELLAILNGSLAITGQCKPPQLANVSFYLFTRNNPTDPIKLDPNNPTQLDPSKKIVMLIHGWMSGVDAYGFPPMIKAHLQKEDCSVVFLDWSPLATQLYTTSYCELPGVARLSANFWCNYNKLTGYALSSLHIVGHSLGAHLAGFTGKYTQSTCQQTVGRISGLDPAGPLYQGTTSNNRLADTDASFVDVMHTNALEFGYWGNIGTVDFQVNCGGILQFGCAIFNIADIMNTLVSVVACSHLRALDYWTESVNSDQFVAKSCAVCPVACVVDIIRATFVVMGDDTSLNPPDSVYQLPTRSSSPFGLGCTPYPLNCKPQ